MTTFSPAAGITFGHRQASLVALAKRGMLNQAMLEKVPFNYASVGVNTGLDYAIKISAQGRRRVHELGWIPRTTLESGYGQSLPLGATATSQIAYRGGKAGRFGIRLGLPKESAFSFMSKVAEDTAKSSPLLFRKKILIAGGVGLAGLGAALAATLKFEFTKDLTRTEGSLDKAHTPSIEGLSEPGISSIQRKQITEFGSGWDPSRGIADKYMRFNEDRAIGLKRTTHISPEIISRSTIQSVLPVSSDPFTKNKIQELAYHAKRLSTEEFAKVLGNTQLANFRGPDPANPLKKLAFWLPSETLNKRYANPVDFEKWLPYKPGTAYISRYQPATLTSWLGSSTMKQYGLGGFSGDDILKKAMFHEAAEMRIQGAISKLYPQHKLGGPELTALLGDIPHHQLAVRQEELFLRAYGKKDLWKFYGLVRAKNPKDIWSWFSGGHEAWNIVGGFNEKGLASALRKILTNFGSGWDRARYLANALGITLEQLFKRKDWQQMLVEAKFVKNLAKTEAGTSVDLMKGVFQGKEVQFVQKRLIDAAKMNKEMGMEVFDPKYIQEMAKNELRAGAFFRRSDIPEQFNISPNIYGAAGREGQITKVFQEYIEGSTLQGSVNKESMSGFLSFMHSQGMTHTDLASRNIITTSQSPSGFAVIDWGYMNRWTNPHLKPTVPPGTFVSKPGMTVMDQLKNQNVRDDIAAVEGLVDRGISGSARKHNTDFGSGFRGDITSGNIVQKLLQPIVGSPINPNLPGVLSERPKMLLPWLDKLSDTIIKGERPNLSNPMGRILDNVPLGTKLQIKGRSKGRINTQEILQSIQNNLPKSKVNMFLSDNRSKLTPQAISDMIDR